MVFDLTGVGVMMMMLLEIGESASGQVQSDKATRTQPYKTHPLMFMLAYTKRTCVSIPSYGVHGRTQQPSKSSSSASPRVKETRDGRSGWSMPKTCPVACVRIERRVDKAVGCMGMAWKASKMGLMGKPKVKIVAGPPTEHSSSSGAPGERRCWRLFE